MPVRWRIPEPSLVNDVGVGDFPERWYGRSESPLIGKRFEPPECLAELPLYLAKGKTPVLVSLPAINKSVWLELDTLAPIFSCEPHENFREPWFLFRRRPKVFTAEFFGFCRNWQLIFGNFPPFKPHAISPEETEMSRLEPDHRRELNPEVRFQHWWPGELW